MELSGFFEKVEKLQMVYRILIGVGIFVAIIGLFLWMFYVPRTQEIARLSKEIVGLKQKVNEAKKISANLAKFEKEQAEADAKFKEALTLLPKEKEIPSLLKGITELGKESNLEFRTFRPSREAPKNFYVEIPISIEVRGKYHDVAIFFDRVSKMKRVVNIFDVSMTPESKPYKALRVTCKAVTYRFKGS